MAGITFNEDDSHYLDSRSRENKAHDVNEMIKWADQYAGTQVKEMLLNVNASRSNIASKVRDALWEGYDPDGPDDQPLFREIGYLNRELTRKWVHAAWKIHHDGTDMYGIMIDRLRVHGISPWMSVRMNDNHFTEQPDHFFHSRFWRENPDNRRVTYQFSDRKDRALDFGRADTREYTFAYIAELAEKYDFDGLELDWMRFGKHFRPGHEADGAEALNDFTRQVRELLDGWAVRRGHPIKLAARVPSRPEAAIGLGMDAPHWAQNGWIDMLIVAPFWETIDTDIPVEIWRRLLAGTNVTFAAGLELLVRAYPESPIRQYNTLESVRGAAASLLQRGVDRIYLFNYFDSDTTIKKLEDYPALLREVGSPDTLEGKRRRHILTYPDTMPVGAARFSRLPAVCAAGTYEAFRIHIGNKPQSGKVRIVFGMRDAGAGADADAHEVRINGTLCRSEGAIALDLPLPEEPLHAFEAPLPDVMTGYNVIELCPSADVTVTWVEIEILPA